MGRKIIENPGDCPLTHAMNIIGGKWKLIIIYFLSTGPLRFGKLLFFIPAISRKVMVDQLKELEADGLIIRTAYAEIPPRVEYHLSDKAEKLMPILQQLSEWSKTNMATLHFS